MRFWKRLDERFEEDILVVLLAVIACVMLAQIVARYVFRASMPWPEEFCRLCWIWTAFLSLPCTIRRGNMLRVSLLAEALPAAGRKALTLAADAVVLLVMAAFFRQSFTVTANYIRSAAVTAAMGLPLWQVYGVTVIAGFGLGVLRAGQRLVRDALGRKDGEAA